MDQEIRDLDEWIYALSEVLFALDEGQQDESIELIRKTMDRMRERRRELVLRREKELAHLRA